MPKIKVTLNIGYLTAIREDVIEIDDQEWTDCETDEERDVLKDEYWKNWSNEYIEGEAELIE